MFLISSGVCWPIPLGLDITNVDLKRILTKEKRQPRCLKADYFCPFLGFHSSVFPLFLNRRKEDHTLKTSFAELQAGGDRLPPFPSAKTPCLSCKSNASLWKDGKLHHLNCCLRVTVQLNQCSTSKCCSTMTKFTHLLRTYSVNATV